MVNSPTACSSSVLLPVPSLSYLSVYQPSPMTPPMTPLKPMALIPSLISLACLAQAEIHVWEQLSDVVLQSPCPAPWILHRPICVGINFETLGKDGSGGGWQAGPGLGNRFLDLWDLFNYTDLVECVVIKHIIWEVLSKWPWCLVCNHSIAVWILRTVLGIS